ncbi:hypothetical protein [Chryseobacterium sp. ISL-6]|nr:hypothetical protein [Chryseobacterium sp. ISL-6]MBT2623682.1 hypothetical protein [Chryseobacterium sp. ISL-6]
MNELKKLDWYDPVKNTEGSLMDNVDKNTLENKKKEMGLVNTNLFF